jgi:FAD/FMN-containing dehydrogenase
LAFARDSGLEIAVRGGGHSVAGRSTIDDGVLIDLSLMKEIQVDPDARTVRAQGGVLWGELNNQTAAHGLATTGGVISTTGIAGLTLGGGLGWMMATHGLAADNLLSVELVTASGDLLTVKAEEHSDLFWALRGGGGNFGVASSFEYRLHPLTQILGGIVAHPFEAAKDGLRFYREFTQSVPDELTIFPALVHSPDGSGMKMLAFVVAHFGSSDEAERDLKPLRDFGSPLMAEVGPMPYPVLNTLLDGGFPKGALNYWKSSFLESLDDGAIDTMVDRMAECPSPMSGITLEHFHGAVTRVPVQDTAVPHREPGYDLLITSVWMDPSSNDENIAWARETYSAMEPYLADRRYINYLDQDEGAEAARSAFGPNFARLAEVKEKYDPDNVFRLNNQTIEPARTS